MKLVFLFIFLFSTSLFAKEDLSKKKVNAKSPTKKSAQVKKSKVAPKKKTKPVANSSAAEAPNAIIPQPEKISTENQITNGTEKDDIPGSANASPLTIFEYKDCNAGLARARTDYEGDRKNLLALQHIAECTKDSQVSQLYGNQAKDLFQNSKIFSIVPKMLEVAQVKDLIPILNEIELKKDKTISDFLMLNEIYERLGEPEKQIQNLNEAMKLGTNDARPLFLLASKKVELGRIQDATALYNDYIDQTQTGFGRYYLMAYVSALESPTEIAGGLVLIAWIIGFFLLFKNRLHSRRENDFLSAYPLMIAAGSSYAGLRFWQSGQAIPFALLLMLNFVLVLLWVNPALKKAYLPVFSFLKKWLSFLGAGFDLARILNRVPLTARLLIGVVSIAVLLFFVPDIKNTDLKYMAMFLAGFVFYSTLGSILVAFLKSRESLSSSLTWISIAATFPFLVSYFIANWNAIGLPLMYARLPSPRAIDGVVNYLLFWSVSLILAIHLGKIIADNIIQPLNEIMDKVSLIERGYFDAKVSVSSRDEIGLLGQAINRMGDGLEKRDRIEKTFEKYVDKKVVKKILDDSEEQARVDGTSQEAVILFADIRGFTTFSEKSNPQDVVKVLNEFFERMVGIVQRHEGIIDKFIGDNLMAVWGVPSAVQDAEEKAIKAGMQMVSEMHNFNKHLASKGLPQIAIGVGVNGGRVIAGSIGSSDRMEYTVIGDVVNSAQRAESNAKPMQMLVTAETFLKVADKFYGVEMEAVKVKGKDKLQHYWTVTGIR